MADPDIQSTFKWIERVKSEGSVPFLEPDDCQNGWATPPGDIFMVRGSEYLTNKVKIPGGNYLLEPLGFDWVKGPSKIKEILKHPNSRVMIAINQQFPTVSKPFVWAFNLQVPSKDNYSAIAYFISLEPIPDDSLMTRFLKEDDSFRNSRLKLIANVVKGPWLVRTAVGEQAICILGRAIMCKYSIGENFIEVDVDIGSSVIANAIVHVAFSYVTTLTVDLAFLIEGQTESELPECILGAVRFSELDPSLATLIEPQTSDDDNVDGLSSFPTRFLKSIGQGFSHLLHTGSQDESVSSTMHTNGNIHKEDSDNGDNEEDPSDESE